MCGRLLAILGLVAMSLSIVAPVAAAAAQTPCSLGTPCQVAEGEYAPAFPPDWAGKMPLPAMMFFHGHNSDMGSTIRSGAPKANFVERGWLLIAPQGERAAEGGARGAGPARRTRAGGTTGLTRWPCSPIWKCRFVGW